MALALFLDLASSEGVQVQGGGKFLTEFLLGPPFPAEKSLFGQIGCDGQILSGFFQAFCLGADAMTDFQSNIPEGSDEGFDALGEGIVFLAGQQDEQVDVGIGIQLAASIPAHGHQGGILPEVVRGPELAQGFIRNGAPLLEQSSWGGLVQVGFKKFGSFFLKLGFECGSGAHVRGREVFRKRRSEPRNRPASPGSYAPTGQTGYDRR